MVARETIFVVGKVRLRMCVELRPSVLRVAVLLIRLDGTCVFFISRNLLSRIELVGESESTFRPQNIWKTAGDFCAEASPTFKDESSNGNRLLRTKTPTEYKRFLPQRALEARAWKEAKYFTLQSTWHELDQYPPCSAVFRLTLTRQYH